MLIPEVMLLAQILMWRFGKRVGLKVRPP
jgi:hypothetical protein